ncbi:MAG: NCS2 family permease [Verrucomicrobia bacterium]|nr:NCS2 family permease [Verrucomicrobiota bacterium]
MRPRWFVPGDIDGFFGLFVDNLLQLMVIAVLGQAVCGFPPELITGRILPGAAISILVGNLYYAWQARQLARRTGRDDVTALPYGINTPSVIAFLLLIMGPVYQETQDPALAWRAGMFACCLSGIMETVGAFAGDWLRRHTPRAALLSSLAGVAITFIAMGFVFQLFASPVVALLPMMLILTSYASGVKLPLRLPAGLVAVAVGTALAWGLRAAGAPVFVPPSQPYEFAFHWPIPAVAELAAFFQSPIGWKYMAVIVPMALFNVIGALQNLESAEAAGDRFETRPSLLANGLGSLCAAALGSAFPTTIYIGHPGWKAMGARAGYSILNGAVITVLCLAGGVTLVLRVVPLEAMLGILLWIGLIITAQAYQESPRRHALAVAIGLVPALASWGLFLVETAVRAAGSSLAAAADRFGTDLYIHGMAALSQGFLLTSMILAAVLALVIDRRFHHAAAWALAGAVLSALGLIHAYELTASGVQNKFGLLAAPGFAAAYALTAICLWVWHWMQPAAAAPARGPEV